VLARSDHSTRIDVDDESHALEESELVPSIQNKHLLTVARIPSDHEQVARGHRTEFQA
jgi:hypothetical protein